MLTPIILVLTPIIVCVNPYHSCVNPYHSAVAVVYIALSAYTPYKVLLTHTIQHQTAQVKCIQTVPCPYNITKQSEGAQSQHHQCHTC